MEEAKKISWNMFDNIETGKELDEATTQHNNINAVMDKVAPWVTVRTKPDYIGKWMTKRFNRK
jgi:hypothetical protein